MIKKVITAMIVLALPLCLAACGGDEAATEDAAVEQEVAASDVSAKQQEAIDAYNEAADAFNVTADYINANLDAVNGIDTGYVDVCNQMADALEETRVVVEEPNDTATDQQWDDLITAMNDVTQWSKDAKAELESALA